MSARDAALPAPQAGGRDDALVVERASATPTAPRRQSVVAQRPATTPVLRRRDLASLQRWFQAVVSAPEEPQDPQGIIRTDGRFPAAERLRVYHYGYQARLVDCLADDFPGVRTALGSEVFEGICHAYIDAFPSQVRTLNLFGERFPAFLAGQRLPRRRALADIATLEWALVEVLHARAAPVLDRAALTRIPLDRWAGARFAPADTLRLHTFTTPANTWLSALREGPAPAPRPCWSAVAVYRQGFDLWRMPLTRPMHRVLDALVRGEPLGEALATLERTPARQRAAVAAKVMDWFGSWVAGGCFAAVHL